MIERTTGRSPTRGRSILVYARSREDLDPVLADRAAEYDPHPMWIEVVAPGASGVPAPHPRAAGGFSRWECEAADLLPDNATANLARWVGGRQRPASRWVRDVESISWLPGPLRRGLGTAADRASGRAVVVCPAERLVPRLPRGTADARDLLDIMLGLGVSVVAGALVRPTAGFAGLFDRVVPVRPGSVRTSLSSSAVIERAPRPEIRFDGDGAGAASVRPVCRIPFPRAPGEAAPPGAPELPYSVS